jgi:hypothetical protein
LDISFFTLCFFSFLTLCLFPSLPFTFSFPLGEYFFPYSLHFSCPWGYSFLTLCFFISYSPLFHFLPFTFFIPLGGIFHALSCPHRHMFFIKQCASTRHSEEIN